MNKLRIAFLTYEYPPDIANGGIATYVYQITKLLALRGHQVEVFCASPYRSISLKEDGVFIHRLKCEDPSQFNNLLVDFFANIHELNAFDIVESPEIHGHAYSIKKRFPTLPLVVKFHMPIFLQMRLMNYYTPFFIKLRFFLGALRRGRIEFYGQYFYQNDLDYSVTQLSDAYVSPSRSLGEILTKEWKLNPKKLTNIPYPFTPSNFLMNIPIEFRNSKVVTFIGKLNVQKGIVNLIKMVPIVVRNHPDVQFRFIGNNSFYSAKNMTMSEYIIKKLKGYENNFVILGGLDYNGVMQELSMSDVCIFPSIWENFPNVCLEAMSAGRAIIGSKNGGMSEMLEQGAGITIDPLNTLDGARAISKLLSDPERRVEYGEKARIAILDRYNGNHIGKKIEQHFSNVILDVKKNYTLP